MTEEHALALLRKKDPVGLSWFIDRYTPYVGTVIWNIIGRTMTAQDAEELTSDVFVVLWQKSDMVQPGKVRGYLGSVARHKAYDLLRKRGVDLALEEDILTLSTDGPETILEEQEQIRIVREAVNAMTEPDREIFIRYYYYCQTATAIGREMKISPAGVRQRLKRGREKLRAEFIMGGVLNEAAYL